MDFENAHLASGDFDEETDPADLNPTIDDCVRMWQQAIEWVKHDTIIGVREYAAQAAGWEDDDRMEELCKMYDLPDGTERSHRGARALVAVDRSTPSPELE